MPKINYYLCNEMEKKFSHTKTFRYEVHNSSQNPQNVLYVLHGYGQLVKFFIRKFHNLPEDIMIVAPEGMHRFYVNGLSGRVGASWMTKEAREIDIEDNVNWLDALDQEIQKTYHIKKTFLLGFSQGGATAARWQTLGKTKFDGMILWASVFPPDLTLNLSIDKLSPSWFTIGNEDELYPKEKQEDLIHFYSQKGYKCSIFEGKHDIHHETLLDIVHQL